MTNLGGVIPANAGISMGRDRRDSRLRGNDTIQKEKHMYRKLLLGALLALMLTACGHSQIYTTIPDTPDGSEVIPPAFALTSDFPADLVIPDIDGMRSTAFVVNFSDPAGVIAIDLDTNPMIISSTFTGMRSPDGSGLPARLLIEGPHEAYLLTSSSIVPFDPTTGETYDVVSAVEPIAIDPGQLNSNGTQADDTITPAYPGGIARIGDKLFVSSANYIRTAAPSVCAPGTIQIFDIGADFSLTRTGFLFTSAFNPTGITVRVGEELIVVNSGVIDIVDAAGLPRSDSSIDIVDADAEEITRSFSLGRAGAAFHGVTLTYDGTMGYVGSAAYGHVYQIDFSSERVVRGLSNPIVVSDGTDYITDVTLSTDNRYLFASSFEQSAIFPFDLSEINPTRGDPFVIGYASGVSAENPTGANTGAGALAVRPGLRGEDYTGADLFTLTGYPGTLVAIDSESPNDIVLTPPEESESDNDPPPDPPTGTDDEPCQGFAQAVHSVTYGDGAGFGQADFPDIVLGPPRGATSGGGYHVLSLGVHGEIVLDLGTCVAVDDAGEDFIVFENAFSGWEELGVVGVSDDGVNFTEFDCDPATFEGCSGYERVFSHPDNGISPFDVDTAGGEAFDLADIGIDRARYIRIRDRDGSGLGGNSFGYDLDAIAVVNGTIENE